MAVASPWVGLLAVAALVRGYAWSQTSVMFNDGPVFLSLAQAIGEGRWVEVLSHPYHPLYPFCIQWLSKSGLALETSAVVISIFGGLLGIVALHSFLRRAFGFEVAWLGAWILALHPCAVDFSSDVMSDGLYIGLYLSAFAAMARMVDTPSLPASICCGVLSALAYLVRPEGVGLVLIGGVLLGWRLVAERSHQAAAARCLLALGLAAGLVMAPYVIVLSLSAQDLTLSQKKSITSMVQGKASPTRPKAESQSGIQRPLQAAIWLPQSAQLADGSGASRPSRDLAGVAEAISRVVRTAAATLRYEVLAFVLVGWFAIGRGRRRARPWRTRTLVLPVILYQGLLVLLVWGAGYVSRRHALAMGLPLIGFAAVGWSWLWTRATAIWMRRREAEEGSAARATSSRMAVVGLVVALALVWGPRNLRERRIERVAARQAAEWLAESHAETGSVAAQKLRTAYYAEAAYVPLPSGQDGELERDLRRRGARWVVIDQQGIGKHLGLAEGIDDWLDRVYTVRAEGRTALVLEVLPRPAS
jgi:4-amino-4-deoxy-L-arabinose transferase-like glycosyltransferase